MSSDDRFSFLLTILVSVSVILGASQRARSRAGGLPDPPQVGHPADAVPMGPMIPEADPVEAETRDAALAVAERTVLDALAASPWPAFARNAVFHPLPGAALGGGDLEQGPPYHLVIDADGAVRWTGRGKAGGQAQPPGLPAPFATKALHVALPDAGRLTPERTAAARVLWREAVRRLGDGGVLFADEVAGSSIELPAGFDRAPYVAAQETKRQETRAAPSATQPSATIERVKIRFGSTTIDAGVAATAVARRDGLMGRTSLRKDEGLLFVYPTADFRSFWMKNCLVALDILYLTDTGEVLALQTLQPPDPKVPEADIPRFASPAACRLVLEVAGGTATASGVKKGTRLELPDDILKRIAKADP